MRPRNFLVARVSLVALLVPALGSCTSAGGPHLGTFLSEQPVFVTLPPNGGVISASERSKYDNNPFSVGRLEGRCTSKPAPGTRCNIAVEVKITVIEGAQLISAGGHGIRPQLVASVENKGAVSTFDTIVPGQQYWVAERNGANTVLTAVRFHAIQNSTDFRVESWRYGTVIPCHPRSSGRSSDMSFRGCRQEDWSSRQHILKGPVLATSQATAVSPNALPKSTDEEKSVTSRDLFSLDDPLWLKCTPGCCTS